ncbi:MAG: PEP-CTERM sorting domain-containing protein [Phycisphaerae bacterium]
MKKKETITHTLKYMYLIMLASCVILGIGSPNAFAIGISPAGRTCDIDQTDTSEKNFSVSYSLIAPTVATYSTLSVSGYDVLGLEASFDNPGSGITDFLIEWDDGMPSYVYEPTLYVNVPEGWVTSAPVGFNYFWVNHAEVPDPPTGIGGMAAVNSFVRIKVDSAPTVTIEKDSDIITIGQTVRIKATGDDPAWDRTDYRWRAEETLVPCYSNDNMSVSTVDHIIGAIGDEWKISEPYIAYRWDFDGDDVWDTDWRATYLFDERDMIFGVAGNYSIKVQVMDRYQIGETEVLELHVTPEPTTLSLLAVGIGGLMLRRRRK